MGQLSRISALLPISRGPGCRLPASQFSNSSHLLISNHASGVVARPRFLFKSCLREGRIQLHDLLRRLGRMFALFFCPRDEFLLRQSLSFDIGFLEERRSKPLRASRFASALRISWSVTRKAFLFRGVVFLLGRG